MRKTKWCGRCKKSRSIKFFNKCGRSPSGLQSYCLRCNNAYRRKRRGSDETFRAKAVESARQHRIKLAARVNKIKARTPCADCGRKFKPWQMQFDHIRGKKIADVAVLVQRGCTRLVFEEIKKCEIVCANCHSDRTYQRRSRGRSSVSRAQPCQG